jgi:hypothetical protein
MPVMTDREALKKVLKDHVNETYHSDIDNLFNEIERLQEYRNLVWFIANDYVELSWEKVKWQRNDFMSRCGKLIEKLESSDE